MSSIAILGTHRLGAEPHCKVCNAGALISFNWSSAQKSDRREYTEIVAHLIYWKSLRRGSLYRCSGCHEVWHLDGANEAMTHVSPARLSLVEQWGEKTIALSEKVQTQIERIGPTPPDLYGNGDQKRVTPCKVTTSSGEEIDPAMVCVQLDAPVQDHIQARLGSDIFSVSNSAFALPLDVRLASSQADEMRMGFYPSLIEMPDGKKFVLNGMTSFMDEPGYEAETARVAGGSYFSESPPPPIAKAPTVTYFVVDGDPGWRTQREEISTKWFQRFFRR
jgi:hypothetical protein